MTAPRRDRTGALVEPDDVQALDDHRCRRGWLTSPDADQPRPCLACRPWLIPPRRQPTRAELDAFNRRHPPTRRTP